MKRILYMLIACICLVSCSKFETVKTFENKMVLKVSDENKTPKSICTKTYLGDNIFLEESVSEICFDNVMTKGSVITTSSINTSGNSFNIEGWANSDSPVEEKHILSDTPTYNGHQWNMTNDHPWLPDEPLTFWSYYITGENRPMFNWFDDATSDELRTLHFTYRLPSPSPNNMDALNSKDFLIAYNREIREIDDEGNINNVVYGTGENDSKNSINISFKHPLSSVKFINGTINGSSVPGDNEYIDINDIELNGVSSYGEFIAIGSGTNDCSFICIPSDTTSYKQVTSRQEIESGKFNDGEYVFFMLPQNLDDVKIKLGMTKRNKKTTFNSNGTIKSVTYSEPIAFNKTAKLSGAWEPGYCYKYKLSPVVYIGGEEVRLSSESIEHSDGIIITEDGFSLNVQGKTQNDEWIAPLPVEDVNVIKFTITHDYNNNSGKSIRRIWLEDSVLNPNYVEGGTEPKYVNAKNIKTIDADLVAEAKLLDNASIYWKDGHYTGYLGDVDSNGKPTVYDSNMNNKGSFTDTTSTMYFYLGGRFTYITIHFEYIGETGSGSVSWTVSLPLFNIIDMVE